MRANMRQFSSGNRGGRYASGGGYTPGSFARASRGGGGGTSGS